jgi:hypothetical protein
MQPSKFLVFLIQIGVAFLTFVTQIQHLPGIYICLEVLQAGRLKKKSSSGKTSNIGLSWKIYDIGCAYEVCTAIKRLGESVGNYSAKYK